MTNKSNIGQKLALSVDRDAIRQALINLAQPEGTQEWCIACGAGKGTNPLEKGEWVKDISTNVFQGKSFEEFAKGLKDLGTQAWCIACGAGKEASPLSKLGNPAELSDEIIDQVASHLLSSITIG